MSHEKFTQPIQAENIEGHESLVKQKMLELQLLYVDKIAKGEYSADPSMPTDNNITDLLHNYTFIHEKIENKFLSKMGKGQTADFNALVIDKIKEAYEQDNKHWIDKIDRVIDEQVALLEKSEGPGPDTMPTRSYPEDGELKDNRAGLIKFDIGEVQDDASEMGVDFGDTKMTIHLEPLYVQKAKAENQTIENTFSIRSLEKLAEAIVDKFPQVKVIKADSWLLDTPLGERVGFNITSKDDLPIGTPAFWNQFIDANGQFSADRVSRLLETGRAPYKFSHGYIPVVEFLKKYLPESKRGIVKLKEVDQNFQVDYEKAIHSWQDIRLKWDTLTPENITELFAGSRLFTAFFQTEAGSEILPIILNHKKLGDVFEDINRDPKLKSISTEFNAFIESSKKYTEKEYTF